MSMLSAALSLFGITLIYTGFLASGRDPITGLATAFAGLILIIKPSLDALRYCKTNFGGGPQPHGTKTVPKVKKRKVHLKIVKSEDDKPTIH
jgi:hypothetical protein